MSNGPLRVRLEVLTESLQIAILLLLPMIFGICLTCYVVASCHSKFAVENQTNI